MPHMNVLNMNQQNVNTIVYTVNAALLIVILTVSVKLMQIV